MRHTIRYLDTPYYNHPVIAGNFMQMFAYLYVNEVVRDVYNNSLTY